MGVHLKPFQRRKVFNDIFPNYLQSDLCSQESQTCVGNPNGIVTNFLKTALIKPAHVITYYGEWWRNAYVNIWPLIVMNSICFSDYSS